MIANKMQLHSFIAIENSADIECVCVCMCVLVCLASEHRGNNVSDS